MTVIIGHTATFFVISSYKYYSYDFVVSLNCLHARLILGAR